MKDDVILNIEHLNVTFITKRGTAQAVNDISFQLCRGEKLGIVGESGCGKSVTSKSIMRLLPEPPAKITGKIFFENEELLSKNERAMNLIRGNQISMIFQEPMVSLNPLFTIGDQLSEVVNLHKNTFGNEAKNEVFAMLNEVGIPSPETRYGQYPFEMSGGMRQRVMIAMALLCNPKILIADEPTTALDVTIQAQILELLHKINIKFGTSIILITHDLGLVAENTDTVAVMYAGEIVEKADVRTIFHDPKHPYTKGLLKSIPTMENVKGDLSTIEGTVPSLYNLPKGCPFYARCGEAMSVCKEKAPQAVCDEKSLVRCWLYAPE